jgi:PadR family transcriptional regulator, regulatory protein PadR
MDQKIEEFRKKFDKELKTGLLSMLVLLAVDKDPKPSYGYSIIKNLEKASDNKFKFPEGTVYPILSSLSEKGFLKSSWGESLEGPRRKYYSVTPLGKKALSISLEDWKEVAKTSEKILQRMMVRK